MGVDHADHPNTQYKATMNSKGSMAIRPVKLKEVKLGGNGGIPLLMLKEEHCRWPLDDGTYCGAALCGKEKSPYCDEHDKRAHQ